MDDRNPIPMPTQEERAQSIRQAVEAGLPPARPRWRELPWSALVFGVEDCLFLAAILGGLCFFSAVPLAQEQHYALSALLFTVSPALYAALQVLTAWKDSQSGTLEWKRTCRVSPRTVAALRMLAFGGAASAAVGLASENHSGRDCVPLEVDLMSSKPWRSRAGPPLALNCRSPLFSETQGFRLPGQTTF